MRDDAWEAEQDEAQSLGRLEYLRLLRLGYIRNMNSGAMPVALWEELDALEEIERERQAEVERVRAAERKRMDAELAELRRKERERTEAPEAALEEYWGNQRQFGKTRAAELWAKNHGVELPVIIEIAETEEEMMEAIRKLRNVEQAKRQQGLGRRKRR